MTKLATILTAAAIALTISSASAHEHTPPRIVLTGANAGILLPDGRGLQWEYLLYHIQNSHKPGYVIWEDGSPGLVSHDGCRAQNPNGDVFALRDC